MKIPGKILSFIIAAISWPALAQTDLSGTWQGNLEVDASTKILVQFSFEKNANDSWSAVLDAPDQPALTNVAADSVSLKDGKLAMNINAISGNFEGEVNADQIQGTWTQQGTSFPLTLRPYQELALNAEQIAALSGSWNGELRPLPNGDLVLHLVFHFSAGDDGKLLATFDSPDEGAFGIGIDKVLMVDDEVTLEINRASVKYKGTLSNDRITGNWSQLGRDLELNLEHGEYQPSGLELAVEDKERLLGQWNGKIGPLTILFRFEETERGEFMAYLDSPDQGATGLPITEVSIDGDSFEMKIAAVGGSYVGSISDGELTGSWTQGPVIQDLTMTRE